MTLLLTLLVGYGLGSIPFGVLLARLAGLGNLRQIGSGNIGATNVLRTGRRDVAALTLLLDGGKGAVAALLMRHFAGPPEMLLAGLAAVFGHCTSPWVGFRGGKGVATGLGVLLAWAWPVGLACCLIWLVTAVLFRFSSLSALVAIGIAPVLLLFWAGWPSAVYALLMAGLIFVRHRGNIARLLAGTEPRIGQKA